MTTLTTNDNRVYASRAGAKLEHALKEFNINVSGLVCADLGCSTGGFTDCLLQAGCQKVYAVDTGYGVLAWKLRQDSRVVALERTNALHVTLPHPVDLVTVDASWTPQRLILPHAVTLLKTDGEIIVLFKPHYEARRQWLDHGRLRDEFLPIVLEKFRLEVPGFGLKICGQTPSPLLGEKGGNAEFLFYLRPA